jgi:hypothetical protein
MHKVSNVTVLPGYRLALVFSDGTRGTVDVSDLVGRGVFSLWSDPGAFAAVRIGQAGELCWDDQVDLCPDALFLRVTGRKPEEVFPALSRVEANAGNL